MWSCSDDDVPEGVLVVPLEWAWDRDTETISMTVDGGVFALVGLAGATDEDGV